MTAQHPPGAVERLQALKGYNILDTPPEADFDDLTRLAARACDAPYALISLITHDRQWFKSRVGLAVCESPLDESLCVHAIGEPDILIIPDARNDSRVCNNPRVVGPPHFRLFAGAVLRTSQGVPIGTLCVLDHRPRELTVEQRDTLLILARQVMAQLELRKLASRQPAQAARSQPLNPEGGAEASEAAVTIEAEIQEDVALSPGPAQLYNATDRQADLADLVEGRTQELEESNRRLQQEIEERQQAEEALHQAQKMEAIGQLTGGIAHDFNNLLQVIGANLQLLESSAIDEQMQQRLRAASSAVDRGAKLSSQLLAFARRQPLEPCSTNLGRRLKGMDELLHRTLGADIALRIVIDSSLWNTFVDPVQVENVVLNLALNARDAMPEGGDLTIEATNAHLEPDAGPPSQNAPVPGEYVLLTITDTGHGMAPHLVERVFEPFFTTKEDGRGTGLGLSQVYGFVKQSNGHIDILSEENHGTTVRLYLPRAHQKEQVAVAEPIGPIERGSEKVLVAEDNPDVRQTTVALLQELGYEVLEAVDGEEALRVLEDNSPVDLLFSDVVMPGPVKAPRLSAEAKRLQPDIAVLFTSGYTQDAIVHDGRLDPGIDLLSKPYTREQLARKIHHALRNREQRLTARREQVQEGSAQAIRGHRVLMVEDDPEVLKLISILVQELGHQVVEFTHAEQALEALDTHSFDVLFTDIGLPDMSGIELARRVLAQRRDIQVIFASGYGDRLATDDLPGARICTLPKPYNLADIERVLQ